MRDYVIDTPIDYAYAPLQGSAERIAKVAGAYTIAITGPDGISPAAGDSERADRFIVSFEDLEEGFFKEIHENGIRGV